MEVLNNTLLLTLQFEEVGVKCEIPSKSLCDDIPVCLVNFDDWYKAFDSFKGLKSSDEISISLSDNGIMFNSVLIPCSFGRVAQVSWVKIAIVDAENFSDSILLNNICAKKSVLDYQNHVIVSCSSDSLSLINTNDIMLQENRMDASGINTIFGIRHANIPILKTWSGLANKDAEDIHILGWNDSYVQFFASTSADINYIIMLPMVMNPNLNNIYRVLTGFMERDWTMTPVSIDDDEMKSLLAKQKSKTEQKEKDVFLNISKVVHRDEVYALRTLFTDFYTTMESFDLETYIIEEKGCPLYFVHDGGEKVCKTLFLTKKPITEVSSTQNNEENIKECVSEKCEKKA